MKVRYLYDLIGGFSLISWMIPLKGWAYTGVAKIGYILLLALLIAVDIELMASLIQFFQKKRIRKEEVKK